MWSNLLFVLMDPTFVSMHKKTPDPEITQILTFFLVGFL